MKLNEVFQKSYPWEWSHTIDHGDEYQAKFTPEDGQTITADFGAYEGGRDKKWSFEFYRETGGTYPTISGDAKHVTGKISGQGDAFRIFATLKEIFAEFVNIEDPFTIDFTATEPTRQALYSKLLPKLARELGMDYHMHHEEPHQYRPTPDKVFILARKK